MSTERRQENKYIVYTDIVGHTKMLGRLGMAFKPMRERHDELFRIAVRQHAEMSIVKGSGDGFYAAFEDVEDAIEVALGFRRALAHEDWDRFLPEGKRGPENHIRSRVGIHSGQVRVQLEGGAAVDFDGVPRNVAEKVMGKALGNQVLVSRQVRDQGNLNFRRNSEVEWKRYGEFKLREVADTVEIWGLGEAEFPAGAAPVQDPEHRVIIFAVVHDHSMIIEQAGPLFEGLKDRWDATFQKAVDAHSRDTFLKRLPEGTLAAFRNAMEAVRVARDFRRMWKAEMRTSIHRLEPKIALDSGLVTFSYDNNRPMDVRDQPVNMAAKVAKTGLTGPWQLILTRPVREDAFANMPERDEFAWVCVGRKEVSGEPEPVELWDFQDVQVKKEDRTVLWVDLAHIRDDLKSRRDVYIRFVQRLDSLLGDALQRRAEEAWTLQPDAARIAAFRDPVEAVQAALDLRQHALSENWGTIFQNRGKGWHPLKIVLHGGAVRMTSEDGQRKDIRGGPIDAIKCLADACEMSQVLVSRELKESVARHLPEGEVQWSRVDVPAKDDMAIEGFALDARQAGRFHRFPAWQRYAAVGVAAAVVVGGGVLALRPLWGGSGNGGDGRTALQTVPYAEVAAGMSAALNDIKPTDDRVKALREDLTNAAALAAVAEQPNVSGATNDAIRSAIGLLQELNQKVAIYNLDEVVKTHQPVLKVARTGKDLGAWAAAVRERARVPYEPDPRPGIRNAYERLRQQLEIAGLKDDPLAKDLEENVRLPAQIDERPWTVEHAKAIGEAVSARDQYLRGPADLARKIAEATKSGTVELLPKAIESVLSNARNNAAVELWPALSTVASLATARAGEMRRNGMTDPQIEEELSPLTKAVSAFVRDQALYELGLFVSERFGNTEPSLEQLVAAFSTEAAAYRVLEESRGSVVGVAWPRRQRDELDRLPLAMRVNPPAAVSAARDALAAGVERFPEYADLPWIARNRERVDAERAKVELLFKALAAAVDNEVKTASTAGGAAAPALGPLPDAVTALVRGLRGDANSAAAMIGNSVEPAINAIWEESRRLGRSQTEALKVLQPVLDRLEAIAQNRQRLEASAIIANRDKIGEPGTTVGALEFWLARLADYFRIEGEDPRVAAAARLQELERQFVGSGEGRVPEADLPREFTEARGELRQIAPADFPWIEKNRVFLAGPAERLKEALKAGGAIETALKSAVAARAGAAELENLRADIDKAIENPPVLPAEEPEVFRAWESVKREANSKKTASDRGDLQEARAWIEDWRVYLARVPKELPLPQVDASRPWSRAVADAVRTQRQAAIQGMIDHKGKPEADAAKLAYSETVGRVNGFIRSWAALEDAFANAGQLGDALPGFEGKRLGDVAAEGLADPLLDPQTGDPVLRDALRLPIHRAKTLQAVAQIDRARGGSFRDLLQFATADVDVGIETRVAVWNSMQYGAYADEPDWLDYHKRVFQRVEADIQRMPDKAKAAALSTFLAGDKSKRWMMYAQRQSTYDGLDRAMPERAAFNITDEALAGAPAALRWNLGLYRVDRARRAGAAGEQAARDAIAALLADRDALAAVNDQPAAKALAEALRASVSGAGAAPAAGGLDAAIMGPGSEGWDLVEGVAGGPRLVYQMKEGEWVIPGRPTPRLAFERIQVGASEAYLGTTELSARVVIEALERKGVFGVFFQQFTGLQREGPFVWDYDLNSRKPHTIGFVGDKLTGRSRGAWINLGVSRDEAGVFGNLGVGKPDPDMPMQYVSLPGAVFLARQLGCRLPSTSEWQAAVRSDGADAASANLRDQSFRQALELARAAKNRTPGVSDLDLDQFWPSRADKTRFVERDDGAVFFLPVDQGGGRFKHLIGNVAEIVCDSVNGAEALGRSLPEAATFVTAPANEKAFAIVGDSAMGEARADPTEPRRINVVAALKAFTSRGWSDVGLRLAFSPGAYKAGPAVVQADFPTRLRQAFDVGNGYVRVSTGQ